MRGRGKAVIKGATKFFIQPAKNVLVPYAKLDFVFVYVNLPKDPPGHPVVYVPLTNL